MAMNPMPSTNSGQSQTEEPRMEDILKTLRFLSGTTMAQRFQNDILRGQLKSSAGGNTSTNGSSTIASASTDRCPKCTGVISLNQNQPSTPTSIARPILTPIGRRSREQILTSLDLLEVKLKAVGQSLPPWVQAYRSGDSLKAAKMIHLDYMDKSRSPVKRPRSEVGVASSTTSTDEAKKAEDDCPGGNKRRRSSCEK